MLVGALFDFDACHVRSRSELPQVSVSLLLVMSYRPPILRLLLPSDICLHSSPFPLFLFLENPAFQHRHRVTPPD